MDSVTNPTHPEFEFVKKLDKVAWPVWIVVRKGDPRGEQFLARRVNTLDSLREAYASGRMLTEKERQRRAYRWLMVDGFQDDVLAQILNHENIVSRVGKIHLKPFVGSETKDQGTTEEYLVWDFCDAANLSVIFDDNPESDPSYYLPESLCWHVLRSLTRALAWLHDGLRLEFDPSKPEGPWYEHDPKWTAVDDDWLPILHRSIQAKNIYFQHPRGIETYGLCKLADFSTAAVTGHPVRWHTDDENSDISYSVTCREGWESIVETSVKMQEDQANLDPVSIPLSVLLSHQTPNHQQKDRVYSLDHELFSIGSIIFTMMTGRQPTYACDKCGCSHITYCPGGCTPTVLPCECLYGGCQHVGYARCDEVRNNWPACTHNCSRQTIHVTGWLLRARYSGMLRTAVQELLLRFGRYEPNASSVKRTARFVERSYRHWREATQEGREYRDIEDDMRARWKAKEERRMEEQKLMKAHGGVAYVV